MTIRLLALVLLFLLTACARSPKKPSPPPEVPTGNAMQARPAPAADDACAVIYTHDEADYTAGGLYRPGQRDSGPANAPDLSRIPEPVPRDEPRARYGNRSPYTVLGKNYRVLEDARGYVERGTASWYGQKFHGRPTSSLEPYDMCAFTAAHKTLPLPSYVRVTNLENGRSVVVRVNDRGPFHEGRVIDLSYVAALKLGVHAKGTAPVEVRALDPASPDRLAAATVPGPADGSRRMPVPAAPPGAPLAPSAAGAQWLQVGSFGLRANAERLAAQLDSADVGAVEVHEAQARGQTVWRVRVGPFTDAAAAAPVEAKIRSLGVGSPRLLSE